MTHIFCTIFVVSIIFMCLIQLKRMSAIEQLKDSKKLFTTLNINDFKIQNRHIDDCNLEKQYCFDQNDCFNRCQMSNKGMFECIAGVCKLKVDLATLNDVSKCNLEEGMAPFLIGVPELATVEAICKPVDLGIVYIDENTKKVENKMCAGRDVKANDKVDYMANWPNPKDCKCGKDKSPIIIPATENVRQYVQCIKNDDALKWVYDETKLAYHPKENS
ncbi:GSCOCT00007854001.2-RA-CDS [Cotesia congregata]|uniref:Cc_pif3 n=1 Tax=Cotesia congregata TaxID=51543 RepID=B9W488_COTCN|nr:GSCOCT00007854001.2-RA-CDS [Cotesia congregata]CAG5089999.1 Cc_pif3 [Cotesia congregata]CAR31576.4 putative per os infectivity factor PIF-3 [Cotesia congregata]CAR82247.1 putative per os infectivity factor PIF-3 [Cotesia congregata]